MKKMPCVYCVLCGNRDKSVSYHAFPKNEETRKQWLEFCGINEHVLNTVTQLCAHHFREADLLKKEKRTFTKPGAVPSMRGKKRKMHQQSDSISEVHCNAKKKYITTENVNVNCNVSVKDTSVAVDSQCILQSTENTQSNCQTSLQTESQSYVSIIIPDSAIEAEIAKEANNSQSISVGGEGTQCSNIQTPMKTKPQSSVGTPDSATKTEGLLQVATNGLSASLRDKGTRCSIYETPTKAKCRLRFVGDIRTPHLATPRRARKALDLAKKTIALQRRKIKTLQRSRNRSVNRIKTMKSLIKYLKDKNFISEEAAENLEVHISDF